jgi:hypothetical protein
MATTTHAEIAMKIAELTELIHTAHPRMPVLLQDIHKILKADPDNVTLLSDEDIGVITSGLALHTKTEITAAVIKGKKAPKNVSVDML